MFPSTGSGNVFLLLRNIEAGRDFFRAGSENEFFFVFY